MIQPYGLIYEAYNIQTKKRYFGFTTQKLSNRINKHYRVDKHYYFHRSLHYHSKEDFKWRIVGYCYSKEELYEAEKCCIWLYQTNNSLYGYNLTNGGEGTFGSIPWNKGKKGVYTNESKIKFKESKIGIKNPMYGKHLIKRKDIKINDIDELLKLQYSILKISKILGCSRKAINKRINYRNY